MKQLNVVDEKIAEVKEIPVIKMGKSLLPKKEICNRKTKSVRI